MIKIEKTDVFGWESAIRGMRNPMNSWNRSDSEFFDVMDDVSFQSYYLKSFKAGESDLTLMKQLIKAGSDHSKFMRMINVTADINAPLYWWKEYDTYKVGTVANSCSTMHKIHAKEFTVDDFSHDHLDQFGISHLNQLIRFLNYNREVFLETKNKSNWWQIIQLLPTSYNQLRTVQLNYAVLRNMYHSRKNHKLDEWRNFCEWVETLPYAKELICDGN